MSIPDWHPDVLGPPFEQATLPLDAEGTAEGTGAGELVATLVRRAAPGPGPAARRAALYLHGFNDYFFQTELAEWFVARGTAFYALDLRRHGRSLRSGQPACHCAELAEYDEELDAAARLLLGAGHAELLVVAHSTGGLVAPLWVARRPGLPIAGLVLNSPFFAFRQSRAIQHVVGPVVRALARVAPLSVVPSGSSTAYGDSLHVSRQGEWRYDLAWKPSPSFPVRAGWVRAVLDGHRQLGAGLGLPLPALVLASTRTVHAHGWDEDLRRGDAVLDADALARAAPALGRDVTVERIEDGIHDLFLSSRPARERAYGAVGAWLDARLG